MPTCPRCSSPDVGRAAVFWSKLRYAFRRRVPYRCRACGERFLDARAAAPPERPKSPEEVLLAAFAPALKDRREHVRYSCDLVVSELSVHGHEKALGTGRVLNISCGGIQLVLPQRVTPGTTIQLRIMPAGDPSSRRLTARVLGVLALSDAHWALACRFPEPISPAELEAFFQA